MTGVSAAVTLDGVTKAFPLGNGRTLEALNVQRWAVPAGRCTVLTGPSGSGKTTLLQLLGALDRASAGRVLFEGRDLGELPDHELAALRLRSFGFVFQQFNLIPTLTALENVEAKLAPVGGSRERALELLGEVGLAERQDHLPQELSGGEQQRVAIARALSVEPRVVLADEPTGNLDTATGEDIMRLFERLHAEGNTIILVTHERDIAQHAHRTIHIRDGKIESDERR